MGILFLIKTKMGFTAEDLQACETFLNENQFLSGKDLPGCEDMGVLEGLNANGTVPDFEAYPNVFGWFWTLNALNAPCRALYNVASMLMPQRRKKSRLLLHQLLLMMTKIHLIHSLTKPKKTK